MRSQSAPTGASIALGLLNPSNHLFPDQTQQFVEHCEAMIEIAMGKRIAVLTPLIGFSKSDVLVMARALGVQDAYSCHSGGDISCGVCVACVEIANAKEGG